MKTAICTIAKLENNYIAEWVNYHLSLGFTNIYIYDNNDIDTENISDIIHNKHVTIINVQGIHKKENQTIQYWSYTNCYLTYGYLYDYMLFIDCDEFLILENDKNVNTFLSKDIYKGFDQIRLFFRNATDNNLVRINNNYSVLSRFTQFKETIYGSSFLKTKLCIKKIGPHGCSDKALKNCNVLGEQIINNERFSVLNCNKIYKIAYFNHYPTKTIEEYISIKLHRGYPDGQTNLPSLDNFFKINEKTPEKLEYLKSIGIDYN